MQKSAAQIVDNAILDSLRALLVIHVKWRSLVTLPLVRQGMSVMQEVRCSVVIQTPQVHGVLSLS